MAVRKRRAEDIEGAERSTATTSDNTKSTDSLHSRQCLSVVYKDKRLRVSEDRSTVTSSSDGGYSSILATCSACSGKWYFEIHVEELGDDSHLRIGWSTRRTRYDTPLGSDCFSYAIRDTDCARITLGKRWDTTSGDAVTRIRTGDVVGCLLELPSTVQSPRTVDDPLTFFPNLLCDPENVVGAEIFEQQSSITFFINGKIVPNCNPHAFVNLVQGEYYPAVSLFGKSKVRFDFDPKETAKKLEARTAADMFIPASLMKPKKRPTNFIPRGLTA